jgi:hypothetical protein
MGTLTIMYASIGEELDKKSNILRGIQNLFKIRALEKSSEKDKLYCEGNDGVSRDTFRLFPLFSFKNLKNFTAPKSLFGPLEVICT